MWKQEHQKQPREPCQRKTRYRNVTVQMDRTKNKNSGNAFETVSTGIPLSKQEVTV